METPTESLISKGGTNAATAANARANLGLGNVDNTSDLNKPISNATQTALNGKANASAFASQAAFAAAWGWTPGGGVSAWTDIQAMLTGTGAYVKADGTTGDPTGTITTGDGVEAALGFAPNTAGGFLLYSTYAADPFIEWDSATMTEQVDTPAPGTNKVGVKSGVFQAYDADLTTAAGATGAGNSKYFGTNSSGAAGFYDLPSGGGSFAFDTFPQYEDSAHSSGIAVNGTTLAIYRNLK